MSSHFVHFFFFFLLSKFLFLVDVLSWNEQKLIGCKLFGWGKQNWLLGIMNFVPYFCVLPFPRVIIDYSTPSPFF